MLWFETNALLRQHIKCQLSRSQKQQKNMSSSKPHNKHHRRRSSLTLSYQDFTPQEIEEFQQDFNKYDTDGNGIISREEYKQVARDLELSFIDLDYFDADGNDGIDFWEFLDMIHTNLQITHMKHKFMSMDKNGDGNLSKQELKDGLRQMGFQFDANELDKMFDEVDLDGNNELDIQEFLIMVSRGIHRQLIRN
jgi:Ca2+-binding EF-hand superfamily protein